MVAVKLGCNKCGSHSFFTEKRGTNTGLYCKRCGSWYKWLSKDEVRLFEHNQKEESEHNNDTTSKTETNSTDDLQKVWKYCEQRIKAAEANMDAIGTENMLTPTWQNQMGASTAYWTVQKFIEEILRGERQNEY